MLYKENWEHSRKKMGAWWHREYIDGVILMLSAPRAKALPLPKELPRPASIDLEWTVPEYYSYKNEKGFAETYFGGDFYPSFTGYLGPCQMAGFIGSGISYADNTVWYHETLKDWQDYTPWKTDLKHPHFLLTKKLTERALAGKDKWMPGMADLGGATDLLAIIRGTEGLLFDLIDAPEMVHKATRNLQDIWFDYFNDLKDQLFTAGAEYGYSTGFNVWCPKEYYPLQCDFSAMISPAMYEEFVLPYISEQVDRMAYSMYHLDGPEAIPHLDMLLAMEKLNAIQWVPGAGKPTADDPHWYPMYAKIQKAGKALDLWDCSKKNIEKVIDNTDPRGLLIHIVGDQFKDEAEAREMERMVKTWTERRLKKLGIEK